MIITSEEVQVHAEALKNRLKKASGMSVITVQTTICVMLIIAAIFLKLTGGSYYLTAQSYGKEILKDNITVSDVAQVFNNFAGIIPDTSFFNDGSSVLSSENTQGKTTSSKITSSSGSSSHLSSSGSSSAKSSSAKSSSAKSSSAKSSSAKSSSAKSSSAKNSSSKKSISEDSSTILT